MPPPVKPPNSGYPKLILLISRQTTDRENKNQDVIQSIINASNLGDVETVDGADPANKQQRDDLFKISGLSSQYPQIFVKESAWVQPEFVGDYQTVHDMNEKGQFSKKGVLGIDDEKEDDTPTPGDTKENTPPAATKSRGTPTTAPPKSKGMFCCLSNSAVDDSPKPRKAPAPKKNQAKKTDTPAPAKARGIPASGGNTPAATAAPAAAPWAKKELKKTPTTPNNATKAPAGDGNTASPWAGTALKKTPSSNTNASSNAKTTNSPASGDNKPAWAGTALKKTEPNKKDAAPPTNSGNTDTPAAKTKGMFGSSGGSDKKKAAPASKSKGMFGSGGNDKKKDTPAPTSRSVSGSKTTTTPPAPATPRSAPRHPQSITGTTVTYTTFQRFCGCLPRQEVS